MALAGKTGVLLVGARGHVAAVVICGVLALKRHLCSETGMVTGLREFMPLDLVSVQDLVFGGWDIRGTTIVENARDLSKVSRILDWETFLAIREDLEGIEDDLFAGTVVNCGRAIEELANGTRTMPVASLADIAERLMQDIREFRERNGLQSVVVVNLASTEPSITVERCHGDREALRQIINDDRRDLVRGSTLYAYAAVCSGCPFINFTPSNATLLPGIIDLAVELGAPVMGNDGKTGETLVKSALAPMFKYRNLQVLSWEGYNILGNMDGKILDNPENKESKVKSKDQVLSRILGYKPHSGVSIDYVPSLDDWKTAWDFIHFEGFLNTRMSLQFIWQGCDSALAAPLVLDLIRLADFAGRKKEKGLMRHLACFLKSPIDVAEAALNNQFHILMDYVKGHSRGY